MFGAKNREVFWEDADEPGTQTRAKNCTSWEYYVREAVNVSECKWQPENLIFLFQLFLFTFFVVDKSFRSNFFAALRFLSLRFSDFFFSLLICVSQRTRIFVFAQRNALKKSSVVLCQLFLILNSECVVSQIFASADKEMFYLRNAKHDTFTPKTLFDTLLEGWLGRGEKCSALPCAVVKFNSPSYMLMMFAGNLRACVKSVIKYLTHFPRGDYRHFCSLRVRW